MSSLFSKIAIATGVTAGCLLASSGYASAFTFETNFSGDSSKGDITLESVKVGDKLISDFALVNAANILYNDAYTDGNSGAASADIGDDATTGVVVEDPAAADIVTNLGNKNLNNIVDTEDSGRFEIELSFDKAFSSLLFWERGQNSDIGVRIGDQEFVITRDLFKATDAGYAIDTQEINGAQNVGSYGLKLSDLGISGKYQGPVVLFSEGKSFNGPDFKVVGATVPEPATVLGLTAIAGAFFLGRSRKSSADA